MTRTEFVPRLNIDTMTAQDLRDLEEYIRNEYDYKMKYPMLYRDVRDSVSGATEAATT